MASYTKSDIIYSNVGSDNGFHFTGSSYKIEGHSDNIIFKNSTEDLLKIEDNLSSFNTDVKILGNFYVSGTTTTIYTENMDVKDNIILINSGETGPGVSTGSAGIEVDRGTEMNYKFVFDESSDSFRIGQSGVTGTLQAVATRDDILIDGAIPYWDSTNFKFIDITNFTYISDIVSVPKLKIITIDTGTYNKLLGSDSSGNIIDVSTDFYTQTQVNNGFVDLTNNESVGGIKTFSSFSITPSSAPTTNYQVANKKYVDDSLTNYTPPLTSTQIAFGDASNEMSSENHFTYNSTTYELRTSPTIGHSTNHNYNTFINRGDDCASSTGHNNIAIGYRSGMFNSVGIRNIYLGYEAGSGSVTTSSGPNYNVMIGYKAGRKIGYNGQFNIAIGTQALENINQNDNNIALGYKALYNHTGSKNIGFGLNAGESSSSSVNDKLYIDIVARGSDSFIYGEMIDSGTGIIDSRLNINSFLRLKARSSLPTTIDGTTLDGGDEGTICRLSTTSVKGLYVWNGTVWISIIQW